MKFLQTVFLFSAFGLNAFGLVWPTPNPAFANGELIEAYVQPTVSGNPTSGLYGFVRNQGKKFHEGLDLFGIQFNAKKEVIDSIYAVLPGKIVHINKDPEKSKYGLYIVILHKESGLYFYSLYAHLDSIDKNIGINRFVREGARLGRMGASAGGYTIPQKRAHLHFEIGIQLTNNFQSWYMSQSYETKNWHNIWNGMNLLGVDPLDFYRSIRNQQSVDFSSYLKSLPKILVVRIRSHKMPFFVQNNSSLLDMNGLSRADIVGWELVFSRFGVPIRWKALDEKTLDFKEDQTIQVTHYNANYDFGVEPVLYRKKGSTVVPSDFLLLNIEKLFF